MNSKILFYILSGLIICWSDAYTQVAPERSVYTKDRLLTERNSEGLLKKYVHHSKYKNGIAHVLNKKGHWGMVDHEGEILIPCQYEQIRLTREVDDMKRLLKREALSFYENGIFKASKDEKNDFYLEENLVPLNEYKNFDCINSQLVKVQSQNNKWGLLHIGKEECQEILPTVYDKIYWIRSDDFLVQKDEKWGMISVLSEINWTKEDVPTKYDSVEFGRNKVAFREGNTWTAFHTNNYIKPIVSGEYEAIKFISKEAFTILKKDGKWGMVNHKGTFVIPIKYDEIEAEEGNYATFLKVRIGEKWGVLNRDGQEFLSLEYDDIQPTENFYAREVSLKVKKQGKWGLVNVDGELVFPIVYEKARILDLRGHKIALKKDGKWGLRIKKHGEKEYSEILKFDYDDIEVAETANQIYTPILVTQGNRKFFLQEEGKNYQLSKESYVAIQSFYTPSQYLRRFPSYTLFGKTEEGWRLIVRNQSDSTKDNYQNITVENESWLRLTTENKVFFWNSWEGWYYKNPIDLGYTDVELLGDNYFLVRKDGQEAVIDHEKNFIIEFAAQKIKKYSRGVFEIHQNGKIKYISNLGIILNCTSI